MKENLIRRYLLVECALQRRFTTYGELISELKLPYDLALSNDRKALGEILGKISTDEHAKGLPLLSALVIDSTKMLPGEGFFNLATELGLYGVLPSPKENHYKPWTSHDDTVLLSSIEDGVPVDRIARLLGRTSATLHTRLGQLLANKESSTVDMTEDKNSRILFAHKEQMKCFKFWKQKKKVYDETLPQSLSALINN